MRGAAWGSVSRGRRRRAVMRDEDSSVNAVVTTRSHYGARVGGTRVAHADHMMTVVTLTTLGVLIILFTLRDVVHELFHPEATGSISRTVMRVVWRGTRAIGKIHRAAVFHAGPAILLAVAFTWAILLVLGWTLIYLPR